MFGRGKGRVIEEKTVERDGTQGVGDRWWKTRVFAGRIGPGKKRTAKIIGLDTFSLYCTCFLASLPSVFLLHITYFLDYMLEDSFLMFSTSLCHQHGTKIFAFLPFSSCTMVSAKFCRYEWASKATCIFYASGRLGEFAL